MLLSSDSPSGIAKSMGLGIIGFADVFKDLNPELLILLGDRFESYAAATAALPARIPIAHIHGGESTEGAIDEALRHAITKMSHFHFVATDAYRKRVIQLGESPERVYCVGGLGIDSIKRSKLHKKDILEKLLDFKFGEKPSCYIPPVTFERNSPKQQMEELLLALSEQKIQKIIFTMPNADTDGKEISELIKQFVDSHPIPYHFFLDN